MSSILLAATNQYTVLVTNGLTMNLDAGDSSSYSGSGTAWNDISGNGNGATLVGPTYVSGSDAHFDFNGTSHYAYSNGLVYGNGSTLSEVSCFAWIRTTYNVGTAGTWDNNNWSLWDFDRSEVFTFALNGTGEVQFSAASSAYGGFSSLYDLVGTAQNNNGAWHMVGWTFSVANQEIKMYVDGSLDRTHTPPSGSFTALGSGTTRYGIIGDGSEATSPNGSKNGIYYEGDIGQILFYENKALTLSEVTQNWNATRGRFGV